MPRRDHDTNDTKEDRSVRLATLLKSLYVQVLLAMLLGVTVGHVA